MKTTVPSVRLLCLAAALTLFAACDNNKGGDSTTPTSTPLSVNEIIINPKAAAPGDTVALTADLRSSSPNTGDIPTTKWSANGGSFVEDNKLTVRWVAPAAAGFYQVTVKATNAAGTVSSNAHVFVGARALLVNSSAGAVTLMANRSDFYYLRSPVLSNGVEVYSYISSVAADAVSPVRPNGFELTYAPNLTLEAHAALADSAPVVNANPKPRQMYMGDLTLGTMRRISQDLAPVDSPRRSQYSNPAVSPDAQLIAFQGVITNAASASEDSADVFVYLPAGPTRIRATKTHANHHNYYPSFSRDQAWLTFISDRSGANQWEIYAMPVSGTTVDTNPANVVRMTATGGTIAATKSAGIPALPLRAWNPVSPTLATLSGDNVLYLMSTTGSGASLVDVSGLPVSVSELKWSASGMLLGVAATGKDANDSPVAQVFTVTGTTAQKRYQGLPGDAVRDIVFSPDDQWMVFRTGRAGLAWLQIMDLSGGTLSQTVALTPAYPSGESSAYRAVMSLSPAWGAGDILYFPVFLGGLTPGIMSVDASGAIQ